MTYSERGLRTLPVNNITHVASSLIRKRNETSATNSTVFRDVYDIKKHEQQVTAAASVPSTFTSITDF